MAYERGNFWPHPMLCFELGVREPLEDKAFEEAPVEIKSFAFLDSEVVIVDFRAELSRGGSAKPSQAIHGNRSYL